MKFKDGVRPTKRTDRIPRNSIGSLLLKTAATLLAVTLFGYLVFRLVHLPLAIAALSLVALLAILGYWIPYQKRINRSMVDEDGN